MRRLVGLIALVALLFGAWWLVENGYDTVRLSRDAATSEPATTEAESDAESAETTTPETPAAKAPASAGETDTAAAPSAESENAASEGNSAAAEAPAAPEAASEIERVVPAPGDAPTFDIVRVEPTGETVIAGQAAPNTTVEVLSGPEPIAKAEANERGEWALVLDKPLPPGTHDLAIRTTTADKGVVTLSDQRVAVSVPEQKGAEPLVVLSSPEGPSSVLQVPKEPEIATREPAPATPDAGAGPVAGASPPDDGQDVAKVAPPAATVGESSDSETADAEKTEADPPAPGVATAEAEPEARPEDGAAEAPAAGETESESRPQVATRPESPATGFEPPIGAPRATVEAPATPEPKVGVAAVEAETDGKLYVAGTSTTKEPVRVYIDDELVGEATPNEGGTWLLETQKEIPPGDYTIRADQVEPGSGDVIVRAEVPFEREIEVATLKPSSDSGDPGSAEISGSVAGPMTVIIKRGDNLWRISRELYGNGIRYSTIYQANLDQIRDPDKIYPGQVFVLPAGDTSWQN